MMLEYEILEKAAAIIEEKGHTKGFIHSYTEGSVCAIGAIGLAQGYSIDSMVNDSKKDSVTWPIVISTVPGFVEAVKSKWLKHEMNRDAYHAAKAKERAKSNRYDGADFIYLYNDDVCEDGQELVDLMRDTANDLRERELKDGS